jgi:hypothetical protein
MEFNVVILLLGKYNNFNALDKKDRLQSAGATLIVPRLVNHFLTKLMTGNNSGAVLLTNIRLTCARATGRLPLWRRDAPSAPRLPPSRLFSKSFMLTNRQGRRAIDLARVASAFFWMCVLILSVVYSWYAAVQITSPPATTQKHAPISIRKYSVYEPGDDSRLRPPCSPVITPRKRRQQAQSVYFAYRRPRPVRWRIVASPCFDPCGF